MYNPGKWPNILFNKRAKLKIFTKFHEEHPRQKHFLLKLQFKTWNFTKVGLYFGLITVFLMIFKKNYRAVIFGTPLEDYLGTYLVWVVAIIRQKKKRYKVYEKFAFLPLSNCLLILLCVDLHFFYSFICRYAISQPPQISSML